MAGFSSAFVSSPGTISCRSGIRCSQPCFKEKQVLVLPKAPVRWEWCDCASQLTVLPGLDRIERTIRGTISRASSSISTSPTEHNGSWKANWVTKTRRYCCAKCLLCLIISAQEQKCCCDYNQMENHFPGPGTEQNKHTQGCEESQLCSSYPPAALACERHLKQFWFLEILSPSIYLGSFENLQDAEPCSYKGSGAEKGGWCEMLEGEQKDYKRRRAVKRPASKHHFHDVKVIAGDASTGVTQPLLL